MNTNKVIDALKEARRVMKLTYVTDAGAKFTDAARLKAGEVMQQIDEVLKDIEEEQS